MEAKHRRLLLSHRLAFTVDLDAKNVTGYLFQDGILSENDVERVKAERTRLERTELLLDTLPRKGRKAFSAFVRALESVELTHLANLISDGIQMTANDLDCTDAGPPPRVTSSTSLSSTYPMGNKPRGWCLIINNVTFRDYTLSDRLGSDVDSSNLEALFRSMYFNTWVIDDVSSQEMVEACEKLSTERCTGNCDCVVVCLLSHGCLEGLYGVDGGVVSVDELVHPLADNPVLKNTPKIFIIQSCRADATITLPKTRAAVDDDKGNSNHSTDLHGVVRELKQGTNSETSSGGDLSQPLTNSMANRQRHLVLAFCAFPGSVAYRNIDHGSWYINAFVEVFKTGSKTEGVLDLLTQVNRELTEKMAKDQSTFQVPAPLFTLEKKLILNPPFQ